MKRILPLLAAVVVSLSLVAVPANAVSYNWRDYAEDPEDYGSYQSYRLLCVTPTFSCNGVPANLPNYYVCVYSPWGTKTVNGKMVPSNYLTGVPAGSTMKVTVPAVAGLWTISWTVDGGNTWTDEQVRSEGLVSSYFSFPVPAEGSVSFILTGSGLTDKVTMDDFDMHLQCPKALAGSDGSDVGSDMDKLNMEFPSLIPIMEVLDSITFDPVVLATFGSIWTTFMPTNGTIYVMVSIALAMGILGFVLFGKK